MTTPHKHAADISPVVQSFMARNGVSADDVRSDGRLTLTMDGKFRVHLNPAGPTWVALTTDLMALAGGRQRAAVDDALERLMNLNAGMLRDHPSALVIDERRDALLLQQCVPAQAAGAELETALAEFLNVLPFWQSACASEATALLA